MRLSGKVALITGAARGVGRAIAMRFAAEGADLVLVDVGGDLAGVPYELGSLSQLEHTAKLCREEGAVVQYVTTDVRDMRSIDALISDALGRFGRLDILVNNAGIAAPSGRIVHEVEEQDWQLMLDINLSGAWKFIKALGGSMVEQRSGSIINIASTAGVVGYRHFAGYVAAKHGLVGLTKAVSLDYAPAKVRVNAICPGSIRDSKEVEGRMLSEIARSLNVSVAEHEEIFVTAQPMNELVEPEDIAGTAVWLASDDALRVTGSVITVDAGFTIR